MWQEIRQAGRGLARRPGQTMLAVAALALGIGLVCVQFSFVNGAMLKGLPFDGAERLFHLGRLSPEARSGEALPPRDFVAWREQQTTFEELAGFTPVILNFSGEGRLPQRHFGARVTANLTGLLRVQPALGRGVHPADERPGAPLVVVLGHDLWQSDFGSDTNVVGRSIRVNGEPATVVGVMPRGFRFPVVEGVWTNLRLDPADDAKEFLDRVQVIGRLKTGVSLAAARSEFQVIAGRLAQQYPDTNKEYVRVRIVRFVDHFNGDEAAPILWTMLAMVAGVLLIACANVANLLLARAAQRGRELAIRTALGASRGHIVRQLLIESTLLACVGAAGGLLLALWGTSLLDAQLRATEAPFWFDVSIDWRVVLVTLAATVLAGLMAGLLPALQASRVEVQDALKDDARGGAGLRMGRFNRWLVTGQVAVSCALLVLTGLMAKTVVTAKATRFTVAPDTVLNARLELFDTEYPRVEDRARFYQQLLERVRVLPGVVAATVTSRNPVESGVWTRTEIEGRAYATESEMPGALLEVVSADFFRTLEIPVLQGRDFGPGDTPASEAVAVVNESFARKHWPGESPLGRRLRRAKEGQRWATVVGVVPDLRLQGVMNSVDAAGYYLAQAQEGWGWLNLLVRAQGDPMLLARPVQEAVRELAPDQPVHSLETLRTSLHRRLAVPELISRLFSLFGAAAMFLAAVGIYGVMSFAVNQRVREFGIRFALGARIGDVLGLVLAQGARQLVAGLGVGLALAYALTSPLGFLFLEVRRTDPATYGLVVAGVSLVALAAVWFPARRAASIDPLVALRYE